MKEWVTQVQVAHWLRECHPEIIFWHTPNESDCAVQYREKLRRMGVTPGVPDLIFPKGNDKGYNGLALEMKTQTGKMSKEQLDFFEKLASIGYNCVTAYSAEAAINYIKKFYSL